MLDILWHIFSIVGAFALMWVAADYVFKSVQVLALRLKMSTFATSFIVLGIMTSIPELGIGLNSIAEGTPEVYVGNLIGASFVIFTLIIPLLAIVGNGIILSNDFSKRQLVFSLVVILLPAIFMSTGATNRKEAFAMIIMYAVLIFFIEKRRTIWEKTKQFFTQKDLSTLYDTLKVIVGALMIFFASRILVTEAEYFMDVYNISGFLIGLIVLAVGTNLPELVIGVKAVLRNEKDVAFGDFVGSAAANTFLFGFLTILNGPIQLDQNGFIFTSILLGLGLILFFLFASQDRLLSRREGFLLLLMYGLFLFIELV